MSTPQAYIAISPNSGNVLTNSILGDLMIYGTCNTQKLLWGYSNSNAVLTVSSSNLSFGGSITMSNQLQLNGLIITQRQSSTINNMTLATPVTTLVTGNGTFTQVTMLPGLSNAIQFMNGSTEFARFSSNGFLGIGTSNPQYNIDVNGSIRTTGQIRQSNAICSLYIQSNIAYTTSTSEYIVFGPLIYNNSSYYSIASNNIAAAPSGLGNTITILQSGIYRISINMNSFSYGRIGYSINCTSNNTNLITGFNGTSGIFGMNLPGANINAASLYDIYQANAGDTLRFFQWLTANASTTNWITTPWGGVNKINIELLG